MSSIIIPYNYKELLWSCASTTKSSVTAANALSLRLMGTGFTFTPATHGVWADVSGSELATGFGYTQGGQNLTGVVITATEAVTVDGTNYIAAHWGATAVQWDASGGDIGPSSGAMIVDNDATNLPIVGYLQFDAERTALDGNPFIATVQKVSIGILA